MADRFDKFTERARRALQAAQQEAVRLGHDQIASEHLLLGLMHDPAGVAVHALRRMDVKLDDLTHAAATAAGLARRQRLGGLSESARRTIELAVDEARRLDHHYVGTEHLLLGLLRVDDSPAAKAMNAQGVTLERTRSAIGEILNAGPTSNPTTTGTPREVRMTESGRAAPGSGASADTSSAVPPDSSPEDRELFLQHVSAFLADPANLPAEAEAGLFGALSDAARQVLRGAHAEAQRLSHNYIGTEHLLLGLVREPQSAASRESVAGRVLSDLGANLDKVRSAVEFIIGRGDRPLGQTPGLTPRAKRVLFLALDEAHRLGHAQVGSEHVLLGIIREGESIASGVLESLVVSTDRIRTQMLEYLGQAQVPQPSARLMHGGRSALLQAQLVARWYYHPQVDTEHLLVGLVRARGVAARALHDLGVQLSTLLEHFESLAPADAGQPTMRGVEYTLAAQAAIERATWEADQRSQSRAGSGHLLLGVLAIEGGHARDLLDQLGVSPDAVRQAVEPVLAGDEDA